jgi:hypothetical protein
MTISTMKQLEVGGAGSTAYTVICKSGERGKEFSDPRLAALAFLQSSERDRPFVLRHRGGETCVIASAKAGAKHIEEHSTDELFHAAYDALENANGPIDGNVWLNG